MAIDDRSFCWYGITSPDIDRAKQFYNAAVGWQPVDHTFPNGDSATMFVAGEVPRAHLRAPETGEPNHWTSYLRVEDVDASLARALAAGGQLIVAATDIAPGRFAGIASPSGAPMCLFREGDSDDAGNAPAGVGHVHWTELQSKDIDADRAWLEAAFGFETARMPAEGMEYYLLNAGGQPRGGLCRAYNADVAGTWLNWVEVDDADAAVERIRAAGGQSITDPSDYPDVGRLAIVADPDGATFGVMKPA
jgi:hypothetical protein